MFLTVYLPTFVMAVSAGILVPVLPVFASDLESSFGVIGLILAGEALGGLLADVPAGILLTRLDRKWVMAAGTALIGVAVLALFWAGSGSAVFLWRVLAGIGGGLWNLSLHSYVTEVTLRPQRGRAIALLGGITRLGRFTGPALGGLIAGRFGLRGPFLFIALLTAFTLLLLLRFMKQAPSRNVAVGRRPPLGLGRAISAQPLLLQAGSGQLMAQMVRAGRQVLVPLWGATTLGLGVETVGLIVSLAAAADAAMFYPAGWLMDRRGRKFAIVPSFFFQGAGLVLLPLSTGPLSLLLVATLMGLASGLGSGTMMTLGADLAPEDVLGPFLGLWRLIGDGGSMGGPLVVGAVAGALSLGPASLAVSLSGFLAAGLFAYLVPETLKS